MDVNTWQQPLVHNQARHSARSSTATIWLDIYRYADRLIPRMGALLRFSVLSQLFKWSLLSAIVLTGAGCSFTATEQTPDRTEKGFESTVNLPENQKILLFIGQDNETINDYVSEVQVPLTGFTLYTSIGGDLDGIHNEINVGAGRIYFRSLLKEHPDAALSIGVWMGDTIREERSYFSKKKKNYHKVLKKLIAMAKEDELLKNRPIFLRLAYEFDAPWNGYNSEDVKEAFRIAKKLVRNAGAANIALVWQSATFPSLAYSAEKLEAMYPGDEYVDWVGISVFHLDSAQQKLWSCADAALQEKKPSEIYRLHLDFARKHNKPVMIAEASPQGFNLKKGTWACIWGGDDPRSDYPKGLERIGAQAQWDLWFRDFFTFIHNNSDLIRAVSYINSNWDEQYMWQCKKGRCPNGYWGNARIQDNALILKNWKNQLLKSSWKH